MADLLSPTLPPSADLGLAFRRFLLEWMSFLYRYVPVGLLEVVPQVMQWRPPAFYGRSDLETLLARYSPPCLPRCLPN